MIDLHQLGKTSIVIPLGPHEDLWEQLLIDILELPSSAELIFVYSDANSPHKKSHIAYSGIAADLPEKFLPLLFSASKNGLKLLRRLGDLRLILVQSLTGRARAMNKGASFASGDFLWFLHADSHFTADSLSSLNSGLTAHPDALHFFRLTFMDDGGSLVRINQWTARIRSEVFKMPFGDQGFCLSRANYERIGGFPETAAYGEDHLFLWKARQLGIKPLCTGTELCTSARKYRHRWVRLTLKYQVLWLKQALPQYWKLLMGQRM